MKFIKEFVTEGTKKTDTPISITPFLLDAETRELDTKFEIDVHVDGVIYEYSFSVNRAMVTEEKLLKTDQTGEKLQFKRGALQTRIGEFAISIPKFEYWLLLHFEDGN